MLIVRPSLRNVTFNDKLLESRVPFTRSEPEPFGPERSVLKTADSRSPDDSKLFIHAKKAGVMGVPSSWTTAEFFCASATAQVYIGLVLIDMPQIETMPPMYTARRKK